MNAVTRATVKPRNRIFGAKSSKLSPLVPIMLSGKKNSGIEYINVSSIVINASFLFVNVIIKTHSK